MSDHPFTLIGEFCRSRNKGEDVHYYTYAYYSEAYVGVLKKHLREEGEEPDDGQRSAYRAALLSEPSLNNMMKNAETSIQSSRGTILADTIRDQSAGKFWINVWTGIVSSFLYSLLVVAVMLVIALGNPDVKDIVMNGLRSYMNQVDQSEQPEELQSGEPHPDAP